MFDNKILISIGGIALLLPALPVLGFTVVGVLVVVGLIYWFYKIMNGKY